MDLAGKKIILGITGGIAAYKSVYLLRLMVGQGADVQVVMTPAAREFVGPVTFSALSGKPVLTDFFSNEGGDWNSHVEMGVSADLMVIAPLTATTLGKMAGGIADNLLVTTYLSARCPVVVAPAMDLDMYAHPSTRKNLETIQGYGNVVIGPATGELASGLEGPGRMEEPEVILESLRSLEPGGSKKKALNKRVLVTAGPTREPIDPVRYLGNRSSGLMGYAIADAYASRGAKVTLISGPVSLTPVQPGVEVIRVTRAEEMYQACRERFPEADIAVFNAAVADYTPAEAAGQKVKRGKGDWNLRLVPTTDIAAAMGRTRREGQFLVGFALETENGVEHAGRKLEQKNLDLIVLNTPGSDSGFDTETNRVTFIDRWGGEEEVELKPKRKVAEDLVARVEKLMDDG